MPQLVPWGADKLIEGPASNLSNYRLLDAVALPNGNVALAYEVENAVTGGFFPSLNDVSIRLLNPIGELLWEASLLELGVSGTALANSLSGSSGAGSHIFSMGTPSLAASADGNLVVGFAGRMFRFYAELGFAKNAYYIADFAAASVLDISKGKPTALVATASGIFDDNLDRTTFLTNPALLTARPLGTEVVAQADGSVTLGVAYADSAKGNASELALLSSTGWRVVLAPSMGFDDPASRANDLRFAMAPTSDGGVVVASTINSSASDPTGAIRTWKLSGTGAQTATWNASGLNGPNMFPSLAPIDNGNLVLTYWSRAPDGSGRILGSYLDQTGLPLAGTTGQINQTELGTSASVATDVVGLPGHPIGYVAAWEYLPGGALLSGTDIRLRRAESAFFDDVRGNGITAGTQSDPALALMPDGRVLLAYLHAPGLLSSEQPGIRYGFLDPRGTGPLTMTGTARSDGLAGRDGASDTFRGLEGNDRLWGLSGNDELEGGAGDDELDGGDGFDVAAYTLANPGQIVLRTVAAGALSAQVSLAAEAGTDTLRNFEAIRTTDGTVVLGDGLSGLFRASLPGNDNVLLLGTAYSGPVSYLQRQLLGSAAGDIFGGTAGNDFVNALGGDDAVNAGAGADVVDGGTGSNFLTGGADRDVFFVDGRGFVNTWSTITDWEAGEELVVWGWKPGISRLAYFERQGTTGFTGATMHADLDGDGAIDTSVTWAARTRADIPVPLELDGLLWFK